MIKIATARCPLEETPAGFFILRPNPAKQIPMTETDLSQRWVYIDTEEPSGLRGMVCRTLKSIGDWFSRQSLLMHIDYSDYPPDWPRKSPWRRATPEERLRRSK